MTRKKEERKVKNAKRKIWLKAGIYPDFSRLCHRSGECLAVPVYYRKIRWSSICIDLFGISGAFIVQDVAPLYKLHEAVVSVAHVALLYLNVATKPFFHTAYNVIELPLVIPATSC